MSIFCRYYILTGNIIKEYIARIVESSHGLHTINLNFTRDSGKGSFYKTYNGIIKCNFISNYINIKISMSAKNVIFLKVIKI